MPIASRYSAARMQICLLILLTYTIEINYLDTLFNSDKVGITFQSLFRESTMFKHECNP